MNPSTTFKTGLAAYLAFKADEEVLRLCSDPEVAETTKAQNKERRKQIKECYVNLIYAAAYIEAYALFRVATEVFLDDYTAFVTGHYITRLSDFI